MSRSWRKTPIMGNCGHSEKDDKRIANRALRAAARQAIARLSDVFPLLRETSNRLTMNKDGKHYFGPSGRKIYWDTVLGRNPDGWKKWLRK